MINFFNVWENRCDKRILQIIIMLTLFPLGFVAISSVCLKNINQQKINQISQIFLGKNKNGNEKKGKISFFAATEIESNVLEIKMNSHIIYLQYKIRILWLHFNSPFAARRAKLPHNFVVLSITQCDCENERKSKITSCSDTFAFRHIKLYIYSSSSRVGCGVGDEESFCMKYFRNL